MTWVWTIRNDASRDRAVSFVSNLDLSNERKYEIVVKEMKGRRTLSQNALFHAWVREVAEYVSGYTGFEFDEIKHILKEKFLEPKVLMVNGEAIEYRSTAKLDTKEMYDFMERVYRWATTDLGLTLPLPPTAEQRG